MTILYIDLETIPSQNPVVREEIAKTIMAPGQYKKKESIDKWMEEHKESAIDEKLHKTCFDGTFGEIVCIGWALDGAPPENVHRGAGESEQAMIMEFFEQLKFGLQREDGLLSKPAWAAHNGTGFDFRFLWQRCVVLGVKPCVPIPYDAKPWSKDVIDTLTMWTGMTKTGGSLDRICKAFGLEGKADMDGSKVYQAWLDGEIKKISEYCEDDVTKLRQIHNRMMFY